MRSAEKTKKHFNETASDYNNSGNGRFVEPMYDALLKALGELPGRRLLDVGCGNGNLFKHFPGEKYELFGVDFSENMISEAKKQCGGKASFFISDAERLPFEDNSMDIITCNASFHHYVQPGKVLREMHRVLKKGGALIIGDPYIPAAVRPIMNLLIRFSKEGDHHFYGFNEMKRLFTENGFSAAACEKTGEHIALYTAVRP